MHFILCGDLLRFPWQEDCPYCTLIAESPKLLYMRCKLCLWLHKNTVAICMFCDSSRSHQGASSPYSACSCMILVLGMLVPFKGAASSACTAACRSGSRSRSSSSRLQTQEAFHSIASTSSASRQLAPTVVPKWKGAFLGMKLGVGQDSAIGPCVFMKICMHWRGIAAGHNTSYTNAGAQRSGTLKWRAWHEC